MAVLMPAHDQPKAWRAFSWSAMRASATRTRTRRATLQMTMGRKRRASGEKTTMSRKRDDCMIMKEM